MKLPPRESNDPLRAAAAASPQIVAGSPSGDSPRALSALAIVPARIGSVRLPRKMLLTAAGRPLFVHTVRNAQRSRALERVIVATDSAEIVTAAKSHGITALLTDAAHQSGTDRVQEAYCALAKSEKKSFDVVVNVQGDEPILPPDHIDQLVAAFADPSVEFATLCAPIEDAHDLENPAVVKVVRDLLGNALYFSRAAIPAGAHGRCGTDSTETGAKAPPSPVLGILRHVGVYAFRPAALARFCALPKGALETRENLEQLRWLEAGEKLRCLEVDRVAAGIDTLEQFEALRRTLECSGEASDPSSSSRTNAGQKA